MKIQNLIRIGSLGLCFILSGCNSSDASTNQAPPSADASACPNSISLAPAGLSALPATYSGDGKPGVYKLDRIEYYVTGSNLYWGNVVAIGKFVENIDPHASQGVAGSVQTSCFSGEPTAKFDLTGTLPLEISRKDMQVLGVIDNFSYQNKSVTAHTLKSADAKDLYSYLSVDAVSLDETDKKAYQLSDTEFEIIFHTKLVMGSAEMFSLAHYAYDPQEELDSSN